MFGSMNPVQELPLTLVTDKLIIQGTVLTRVRRLTDLVNDPDTAHLVLQDATFMELGSRRVVANGIVAQVRLSDLLFVHSSEPTESGSNLRMPKQPVKATLLLPPFTVQGTIHLPYEAELRLALEAYGERFVPVTGARYWAYSVAELPTNADLLVVNHGRAHVSIAAGVEWAGDGGPANFDVGGDQNPW
ncbi:MAG: hypothetical protein ABSA21_00900 [Candidatus Limnocylindrales bacterium]|jgi:hypothetical protein